MRREIVAERFAEGRLARVAAPPTLGNGNGTLQSVTVSIGQRGYGTTLRASCRERGTASRLAGPEGKSRA